MRLAALILLLSGCAEADVSEQALGPTDHYALFGSPVEREEFTSWYGALVIEEEPFESASIAGDPDSGVGGWEATFHARHGYFFFLHVIVSEGSQEGQGFHRIRWNTSRTRSWTGGALVPVLLVALGLGVRARRRKKRVAREENESR